MEQPGEKKKRGNPNIAELGRLTRFQPGHHGLPGGGRPKKPFSDRILEQCERHVPELILQYAQLPAGTKWAELVVEALFRAAAKGNVQAAEWLADHVEGRPAGQPTMPVPVEARDIRIIIEYEEPPKISEPTSQATAPTAEPRLEDSTDDLKKSQAQI